MRPTRALLVSAEWDGGLHAFVAARPVTAVAWLDAAATAATLQLFDRHSELRRFRKTLVRRRCRRIQRTKEEAITNPLKSQLAGGFCRESLEVIIHTHQEPEGFSSRPLGRSNATC